jgi:hypothetical protein
LVGNTCHNVYNALIDEVMTDLVNRRIVVTEEDTINYGEIKMQKYRRGPALDEEGCRRITSIGLGDLDTYIRFSLTEAWRLFSLSYFSRFDITHNPPPN